MKNTNEPRREALNEEARAVEDKFFEREPLGRPRYFLITRSLSDELSEEQVEVDFRAYKNINVGDVIGINDVSESHNYAGCFLPVELKSAETSAGLRN